MRISSLLLIIFITAAAYPQKVLTLEEAVNIALHKNTTLQRESNNIRTFESGKLASYGNLLPRINAFGDWEWSRSELTDRTETLEGGIVIPVSEATFENRSYSAGINADWVLFDGLSNIAGVSRSSNQLQAAEFSLERLKQDIVFQTISFYYDVINAQQLLKVREDVVKQQQKNLETVTERNKLGAVTLADVYAQQVSFGNAELERIRAGNTVETSKTNLLYYLGLDVFENYTFPEDLSSDEMNELDTDLQKDYEEISDLVNTALNNRLDYQSAKLRLESANDGITMAWGQHLPMLTNRASFSSSANRFENLFDSKFYSVGLTLSLPVFAGFSIDNDVEIARVEALNTEVQLNDLEREIKRSIQTTYLDLQAAEKFLNVSANNVRAAEENLKIEEEKYALGSSKLLDVLVATTSYTTARTDYINSQFAYIVLREQLKYYLGSTEFKVYE